MSRNRQSDTLDMKHLDVETLKGRLKKLEQELRLAKVEIKNLKAASRQLEQNLPQDAPGRIPVRMAQEGFRPSLHVGVDSAYLLTVLNQLPSGVIIAEAPSGKILHTNEKAKELLGEKVKDLPEEIHQYNRFTGYKADGSRYQPEDWPLMRSILLGEKVTDEEICIYPHSGSTLFISASSTPIFNQEGVIIGGVLVVDDITSRKQTTQALQENEARFRTAAETSLDGFAILSAVREPDCDNRPGCIIDFRYDYINEMGCRLNHRRLEEQIGHTLLELLPAHRDTGIFEEYVKLVETGQPVIKESLYYEDDYGEGQHHRRAFDMQAVKLGDGFALTWRDVTERKILKDRLAYQSMVLDNLHEAVIATDLNLRVTSWNKGAETLYGWTAEEAMGHSVRRLLGMQMTQEECQSVLDELRSGDWLSAQVVQRNRQKDALHLEAGSMAIKDAEGNVTGYVATVRDVTARFKDEERLQASETRFRHLADAMPQLVWSATPDGRVDYFNQRYLEFAEIPPGVAENLEWLSVFHPDDREVAAEVWKRALTTGEAFKFEHRLQLANGDYHWFLTRGVPATSENGQIIGWYGTSTDIHDLKQAEVDLRQRSARLSLLADTARALLRSSEPDYLLKRLFPRLAELLELDVCLHYTLVEEGNRLEMVDQFGISEEAMPSLQQVELGKGVCGVVALTRQEILAEDMHTEPESLPDTVKKLGLHTYICFPLVVQERLLGTLGFGSRQRNQIDHASIELLRGASDLFATALDRRKAELELQGYAEKLERSNQELMEFAFVASHDLKEPLRKIDAFGHALLRKDEHLDEEQKDYLHRINKAAQRMQSMVDDLLRLSRISTRPQPFSKVNLSQLVGEVLSDLEVAVQRTGGQVEIGELPEIEADPLQMRQLFQNLIGNALKFHKPEQPPIVKIHYDRHSLVPKPGKTHARQVEITIQDNGIGFPQEEVERVFQPFQRLVGRSEYEGSGIGLAICRKIVERHRGSLTAHSTPGEGSTFTVRLPISQQGN